MARRIGAWSALAAGLGLAVAGAGWMVRSPPLFAWGALALLAGLGALMLGTGREDAGDGMLGALLLRTDRWALGLAAAGLAMVAVAAALAAAGLARFAPPAAWSGAPAFLGALLGALGLLAWACSRGRGTQRLKAAAARHHALAVAFAVAPWGLRAVLPPLA